MIAKQVQGSDFKKVLDYVHNKSGARLIGSNMVGKDPERLTDEFRISSDLRRRLTKCVYHASLSLSAEAQLRDPKWLAIAQAYLQGMNFEGCQYVVYRHTDTQHDHIHIVANRIRITDGTAVSDSWNYRRGEMVARQLEQQFGLSPTQCSWEKNKRSPKTGEIRRQRRTGEINQRNQLQKLIEQSLENTSSLDEFIHRLTVKGVSVRLRKSKEGKIEGISYKLDGVAFQGRQLGKDYAWTSLESILLKETSYQPGQSDLITQPDLTEFNILITDNQETESNEIEQQKKRLRDKYISLATQVCKLPQFQDRDTRDIDLGVTLLSLKSGDNLEEAIMILTQSNTVRQWHQELSRDTYLKLARKYIQDVTNKASELVYKHRSKDELQY
jgi:Relaxase/Mobilisation nuclease domain